MRHTAILKKVEGSSRKGEIRTLNDWCWGGYDFPSSATERRVRILKDDGRTQKCWK